MFEHDRSAARGMMSLRKLIVFKHSGELGNAPAHMLFDLVSVSRKDQSKVARAFSDYAVSIGQAPKGVEAVDMQLA
jgi:CRISPR-associated protein Csd2